MSSPDSTKSTSMAVKPADGCDRSLPDDASRGYKSEEDRERCRFSHMRRRRKILKVVPVPDEHGRRGGRNQQEPLFRRMREVLLCGDNHVHSETQGNHRWGIPNLQQIFPRPQPHAEQHTGAQRHLLCFPNFQMSSHQQPPQSREPNQNRTPSAPHVNSPASAVVAHKVGPNNVMGHSPPMATDWSWTSGLLDHGSVYVQSKWVNTLDWWYFTVGPALRLERNPRVLAGLGFLAMSVALIAFPAVFVAVFLLTAAFESVNALTSRIRRFLSSRNNHELKHTLYRILDRVRNQIYSFVYRIGIVRETCLFVLGIVLRVLQRQQVPVVATNRTPEPRPPATSLFLPKRQAKRPPIVRSASA
jgi:hypothetical protein